MRVIGIAVLVAVAIVISMSKPWSKAERLDEAICEGSAFWTLVFLLEGRGINNSIDTADFSTTPLLSALDNTGCPKISPHLWARLLVWFGADINLASIAGYTPLMMAVGQSDADSVEFLLSSGADVSLRTHSGISAIDIAQRLNNKQVMDLLEQAQITRFFWRG